jgi:hypothetical protein
MSVSLDGFICGPEAKDQPYLDEGFFHVTSWVTGLATWREREGMEGGVSDADDGVVADVFAQAGAYVISEVAFT